MLKMLLPLFLFWSSGISLVSTPDVISFSYSISDWGTIAKNGCMMNSVDITNTVGTKPKFSAGTVVCVRSESKVEYFITAVSKKDHQEYSNGKPSSGFLKFTFSDDALADYKKNMTFENYVSYARPKDLDFVADRYYDHVNDEAWYLYGAFVEYNNKLMHTKGIGLKNQDWDKVNENNPAQGNKWDNSSKQYESWTAFQKDKGNYREQFVKVKHNGYWYTTVDRKMSDSEREKRAVVEPGTASAQGYWNRISDIRYFEYNTYDQTHSDILVFSLSNGQNYVGSIKSYCGEVSKGTGGFSRIKECQ